MTKKQLTRTLVLLLAVILIIPLVACVEPAAPPTDGTSDDNTGDVTTTTSGIITDPVVTASAHPDPIPEEVKFGGSDKPQPVKILYWSDVEHQEFFTEGETGNPVENALFRRNANVEERLGIELIWEGYDGDSDNNAKWNDRMQIIVKDNANEKYQCFAGYSLSVAAAACNGYCSNLLDEACEYLNFEDNTYWPKNLLDQVTFGDNLYFCSGDISANALYMMYVCFVNMDMLETHNLQNPQELVEDGNWTYSRFFKMCENVWEDVDDKSGKSDDDVLGYSTNALHSDPWFYGTGATVASYDANGKLVISPTMSDQGVASAIDNVKKQFKDSNDVMLTENAVHQMAFTNGLRLFMMDRCRVSFKVILANDSTVKYSIVPCPKATAAQENYATLMGNPFTLYGIFAGVGAEEKKVSSAFLEYYAYESYNLVTPALFELSLKLKYVDDPMSARMYDIARESLVFDTGRIFATDVLTNVGGQGLLRGYLNPDKIQSFSRLVPQFGDNINKNLAALQSKLDK